MAQVSQEAEEAMAKNPHSSPRPVAGTASPRDGNANASRHSGSQYQPLAE
jgi:hypothetical protein